MIEFGLYSALPKADFHSAVITSFSFNLPYFDSLVLKFLHANKIVSINLLVDQNMMDCAFDSGTGLAYHVGRDYFVNGINSKGAFHPKIYFFVGYESLMMFSGSGNVTFCGNGKNHEVFSGLYADLERQQELPLLQETWAYLCRFANTIPEYAQGRMLNDIQANCSLLKDIKQIEHHKEYVIDKDITASLLYNEPDYSLCSQVYDKLGDKQISKITILSPFFDLKGDAIIKFADMFPKAQIDILISDKCILPPNEMKQNKRISFYHFEETERGMSTLTTSLSFNRNLHAKIIHFTDGVKEYLLLGSANATMAAIGTQEKQALNEEFCIMLGSSKKNFLNDLGLLPKVKFDTDISQMKRDLYYKNLPNHSNVDMLAKIISADMLKSKIVLKLANIICPSDVLLYGYMMHEGLMKIAECQVNTQIVLPIKKNMEELIYCELHDIDGHVVSNRLYVNHIADLSLTNPSKNNRSVSSLLMKLSNGEGCFNEIAKYTLDLFQEIAKDDLKKGNSHMRSKKTEAVDISSIVYDVDFDADNYDNSQLLGHDNTCNMAALISHIEKAMFVKVNEIRDSQSEEEEDGEASLSFDKNVSTIMPSNEQIDDSRQSCLSLDNVIRAFNCWAQVVIDNHLTMSLSHINAYNLVYELLLNIFCNDILYGEKGTHDNEEISYKHRKFIKLGHKLALVFVNLCLKCKLIYTDDIEFELSNAINRTFLMFAVMDQKIETSQDEKYYRPIKNICANNLFHLYRQYYKWDNQTEFWNDVMKNFSQLIKYNKIDKWIKEIVAEESSYKWYDGYGVCINNKYVNEYLSEIMS